MGEAVGPVGFVEGGGQRLGLDMLRRPREDAEVLGTGGQSLGMRAELEV